MAGKTAVLAVKIIGDAKGAVDSFDKAESKLGKFGKVAGGAVVAGVAAAGAATVGLGVALFNAGETAGTSNARIAQIFESIGVLGDGADAAAGRVQDLSDSMARSTGINQNMIKEGAAILGTFSNIASSADEVGGTFDRALASAGDLSAAGFGSVQSASTMLGKALQDPAKGLTALTRVGVAFTDGQKDQIKALQESGDMLGAQNVLMEAVESQVGGVAEATANASDQIKVGFSQIAEQAGTALMPAFTALTDVVLDKVLPAIQDTLVPAMTNHVLPALENLGTLISTHVSPVLGQLSPILATVGDYFSALVPRVTEFVQGTLLPGVQAIAANVIPVFTTIGTTVLPALIGAVQAVIPHVLTMIGTLVDLAAAVSSRVMPIIQALLPVVVTIFGAVQSVVGAALSVVSGIVRTVTAVITGDWTGAWEGIKSTATAALRLVETIVTGALRILQSLWTNALSKIGSAVSKGITRIVQFFRELPAKIKSGLGNLGGLLKSAGSDLIKGFLGGIGNMAKAAANKAKEVASGAVSAVKGFLGISSPSKVFRDLGKFTGEGLVLGLERSQRDVARAAGDLLATPEQLARRMGPLDVEVNGAPGRGPRRGATRPPLVINLHGVVDKMGAAREIEALLSEYAAVVRPA